jgi:hypothetical protein
MGQVTPVNQIVNTESRQSQLNRTFGLAQAINGGLDFGVSTQTSPANYTGNISGQWANVTAPAGANTEFAVPHTLGRIPSFYLFISDRACRLYQLPNTGTVWTLNNVYLKCDTSSAVLRIFLL